MTRVLVFSGVDTGGQGYQLARALRESGWEATAVRRRDSWLKYPGEVTWLKNQPSAHVQRLAAEADVIHLMQVPRLLKSLRRTAGKQIVVQHHGTYFRQNPKGVSKACRAIGAIEAAGELGLKALAPHTHLLPMAVDLELMANLRAEHYVPSERVRIFHSPTDRLLKQTDLLIAAVANLAERYPVDLEIVERTSWPECIRRKATADIVFDQVQLGYGTNAAEAWGMGIPVIAGTEDPRCRALMIETWGTLPFVEARRSTIEAVLESLVADAAYRKEAGRIGRLHAERVHSYAAVATRYKALLRQEVAA